MARFDDFLPDARAGLPSAPDILILNALRRSAIELCRQSEVWQQTLPAFPLVPGQQQYALQAPTGSRVQRVLWAKYNGVEIGVAQRERDLLVQDSTTGPPQSFSISTSAQTLSVWPTPGTTDNLQMQLYVTLVPLPTALTLPDDLAIEYRPGIVAGAKAELMTVSPGMPYHNPPEGATQGRIAYEWIVRAKRRNHNGGIPLRITPVRM